MKILAISDVEEAVLYEETKRAKIGPVDMIISCGDLKESYLSYISTVYQAPLFYVRGNHDAKLDSGNPVGENLHGKLLNYRGIRLLGFEGSPFYSPHAVQYRETEIRLLALQAYVKSFFKGKPDIIVTHGPPQGIHDQPDFAHRGTAVYTKMIRSLKPGYFLHGHTHLSYQRNAPRLTRVGATTVINVYGYYFFEI
jgi:Icc-related predicted phosphoesterase